MIRRTVLLLLLTVTATIAPMATAHACSCMMPDAAQFLQDSDFVFAGSLLERPGAEAGQPDALGGLENVAYTFEVDAVYKGDLRDATVQVWSASNGAACGFEMALGEPVAIAASVSGGQLTGSLCATFDVGQLEAAAADAGIEPAVPSADPPVVASEEPNSAATDDSNILAIGSVAVLAAIVALALRARSKRSI